LENIGYDKDFREIAILHCHPRESGDPDKKDNSGFRIKCGMTRLTEPLEKDIIIKKNKVLFNHRMDFSGIAKGYITDKAAEFLKNRGFQNFLIDSGGDIYASGKDCDGEPWLISIEGADESRLNFNLSDRGVATSGITRKKWEVLPPHPNYHSNLRNSHQLHFGCGGMGKKYHHLINPKNPETFLFDLKSVTVIAENTEKADIWAKTLYLMGKDRGLKYSNENKIASVFLDYKGNVHLSEKIKNYTK
jgi:FAD:protein FMN transferase